MPGDWAYGDDGYFWVPGTWARPPTVGVLWTPAIGAGAAASTLQRGLLGAADRLYGCINYGYGMSETVCRRLLAAAYSATTGLLNN